MRRLALGLTALSLAANAVMLWQMDMRTMAFALGCAAVVVGIEWVRHEE